MRNIANIKNCYGCGLCSVVCKHRVIDIQLNEDGFFQPIITNKNMCVECGLCDSVCSFINKQTESHPIHSYAAWSKISDIRKTSTSGGVSFEIAKTLIMLGYKFCGVKYNVELGRAEHYIASDINGIYQSMGSKYLQSFTKDTFSQINLKEKNLIVGTPCQIASFRRYIEIFHCIDNFILIDLFCHGVPSYLMWEKYLKEHTYGLGKIQSITWRNKLKGWHKSYCITIIGEKGIYQSWNGKDDFFSMYFSNACLGRACLKNCKFKYNQSEADIRIGDFWGKNYKENDEGVCSVIVFSEKGNNILKEANLELHELTFNEVAEGQMKKTKKPLFYETCMTKLKDENKKLNDIAKPVRLSKNIIGHFNRIKNILHI